MAAVRTVPKLYRNPLGESWTKMQVKLPAMTVGFRTKPRQKEKTVKIKMK